jgi:nicotinamide-nucleotide amidase
MSFAAVDTPTQAQLEQRAIHVSERLLAAGERLVTAESCTGGWLAMTLTALAGSSAWFERGWVTYANEAKMEALGVAQTTLDECGAVSEATVAEMATGALTHSPGDWSVAVSGIAGPGGGSVDKPVGTVCFAVGRRGFPPVCVTRRFAGDRHSVRAAAVACALDLLVIELDNRAPPAPVAVP